MLCNTTELREDSAEQIVKEKNEKKIPYENHDKIEDEKPRQSNIKNTRMLLYWEEKSLRLMDKSN